MDSWNPLNWAKSGADVVQRNFGVDVTPGLNLTRDAGGGYPFVEKNTQGRYTAPQVLGETTNTGGATNTGDDGGGDGGSQVPGTQTLAQQQASAAARQQAKEVDSTRALLDTRAGALRGLLGQVGTTRQQGLEQLSDTYNTDKQSAAQKYGLQRTDNAQGRVKALDQVDTGARTGANGLRRLLGLSGSANQSAMGVAMNAVARDASGKRQGQIDTFGRNERDITGAETDYMTRLDQEKKTKESSFLRDLLQQEADINAQIGDTEMQKAAVNGANYDGIRAAYAPYQSIIDQRNNQINGLYDQYKTPFQAKANDVSLGQYTVDKSAINAQKQGGGEYAPYDQFLAKRKLQDSAL